ncbi:MAG TPA: hypothetical protein PKW95_08485 [bacterium]|nr:hypothetical protein [bacterium]
MTMLRSNWFVVLVLAITTLTAVGYFVFPYIAEPPMDPQALEKKMDEYFALAVRAANKSPADREALHALLAEMKPALDAHGELEHWQPSCDAPPSARSDEDRARLAAVIAYDDRIMPLFDGDFAYVYHERLLLSPEELDKYAEPSEDDLALAQCGKWVRAQTEQVRLQAQSGDIDGAIDRLWKLFDLIYGLSDSTAMEPLMFSVAMKTMVEDTFIFLAPILPQDDRIKMVFDTTFENRVANDLLNAIAVTNPLLIKLNHELSVKNAEQTDKIFSRWFYLHIAPIYLKREMRVHAYLITRIIDGYNKWLESGAAQPPTVAGDELTAFMNNYKATLALIAIPNFDALMEQAWRSERNYQCMFKVFEAEWERRENGGAAVTVTCDNGETIKLDNQRGCFVRDTKTEETP